MKREKIGSEYHRSGYGRSAVRKANVYLINGKLYARDKATAHSQFNVLEGELKDYVTVNAHKQENSLMFIQCGNHSEIDKHLDFIK